MNMIKTAVLATIFAMPMMAGATTTDISADLINLGDATAKHTNITPGTFTDFITFDLGALTYSLDGTLNKTKGFKSDVTGFTVTGDHGLTFNNVAPGFWEMNTSILAGNSGLVTLTLTGTSTGQGHGSWSADITASPVPVPGAVWLMGTALIGLVSFKKRKSGFAA